MKRILFEHKFITDPVKVSKQLVKRQPKAQHYTSIKASQSARIWQIDLLDMQKLASMNSNVSFILVCIDTYSRKLYLRKVKSKDLTFQALNTLFSQTGKRDMPKKVQTDLGGEFLSNKSQSIFEKYGIQHITAKGKTSQYLVERANRTVRERLRDLMLENDTTNWIQFLERVQNEYNAAKHRSTKQAPAEVIKGSNVQQKKQDKIVLDEIALGSIVRTRNSIDPRFDKPSSAVLWSRETYIVIRKDGPSYYLQNINGREELKTPYKHWQLQVIPGSPNNLDVKPKPDIDHDDSEDDEAKREEVDEPPEQQQEHYEQQVAEIEKDRRISRRVLLSGIDRNDNVRKQPARRAAKKAAEALKKPRKSKRQAAKRRRKPVKEYEVEYIISYDGETHSYTAKFKGYPEPETYRAQNFSKAAIDEYWDRIGQPKPPTPKLNRKGERINLFNFKFN